MWFRLYDDLPDDLKLDGLTNDQKWLWVVLMCLGSRMPVRGRLAIAIDSPLPMESITKRTGMSPEQVSQSMDVFRQRDMMHREETIWVLTHFSERQFISDSSVARTRQYRERKKQEQQRDPKE